MVRPKEKDAVRIELSLDKSEKSLLQRMAKARRTSVSKLVGQLVEAEEIRENAPDYHVSNSTESVDPKKIEQAGDNARETAAQGTKRTSSKARPASPGQQPKRKAPNKRS